VVGPRKRGRRSKVELAAASRLLLTRRREREAQAEAQLQAQVLQPSPPTHLCLPHKTSPPVPAFLRHTSALNQPRPSIGDQASPSLDQIIQRQGLPSLEGHHSQAVTTHVRVPAPSLAASPQQGSPTQAPAAASRL